MLQYQYQLMICFDCVCFRCSLKGSESGYSLIVENGLSCVLHSSSTGTGTWYHTRPGIDTDTVVEEEEVICLLNCHIYNATVPVPTHDMLSNCANDPFTGRFYV